MTNFTALPLIVLASASPRRTEILTTAGLRHIVIPSQADEDAFKEELAALPPAAYVERLAEIKAAEVSGRLASGEVLPEDFPVRGATGPCDPTPSGASGPAAPVVLGADTIVVKDGKILGKPADAEAAADMIRSLSGAVHAVVTGVAMLQGERKDIFSIESRVHVAPLSEAEVMAYISTDEPYDKAGGYGIQGIFSKFVTGIEGDYFNIVGLPVAAVYSHLKEFR